MEEENTKKIGFFKTVWYSITKFEKYPNLAALGTGKAILYFLILVLIFSVVYTSSYVYYISNMKEYEEDLSLSEKIVNTLLESYDEEELTDELTEAAELLSEYSESYIIGSLFISFYISFTISILMDVLVLSVFGLVTSWIARLKMNYKTVFNMSIYAMTLAIILRMIYSAITILTSYSITYFNVVYIGVSYISLAAAIFLIGSDLDQIKQKIMIGKIEESLKNSEEELENLLNKKPKDEDEDEESEEDKENEKDNESKDEKKDENKEENNGITKENQTGSQGSNA